MVEKPWGRDTLPPPFTAPAGQRIGEVWFEPPPELDQLLVKYIFTSENLSVQVHPSDAQTLGAGIGRQGKEECWLIVAADPGARLGIGFEQDLDGEAMRAAALDGAIEQLLTWHSVKPGDFFYIPANTVHAIGAGVSLIEVQQNSDITYRLYDYGRPRELHLDEAVAVARGEAYPAQCRKQVPPRGEATLVEGPLFRLDRIDGAPSADVAARYAGHNLLVIPIQGEARVDGERIAAGECGLAANMAAIEFSPGALSLIAQPCAS
jgi:mannose-6-phosphate isomerase